MTANAHSRAELFSALEAVHSHLTSQGLDVDHHRFDLEAARVTTLARLVGRTAPEVPVLHDGYAATGRINGISDLDDMVGKLTNLLEQLRESPADFGVEIEDEVEELSSESQVQVLD
jgi:hypothetical protein